MGLTVCEALAKLSLGVNCVVAGGSGVERIISRVNFLEVPDIVQWLDGGELLLTTGYALRDNPELQVRLLHQLAEIGVAALAIKSGRYLTPIPEAMLKLADRLEFPLIELPADLPLSRVMAPIYETLLNQQVEQLKRAEKIHRLFLEVILKGEGIVQIGKDLANLIGKPVVIFDTRFRLLFQSLSDVENEFPWQDIFEAVKRRITNKYAKVQNKEYLKMTIFHYKDWELVIFPIVGSQIPLGYIVVLRSEQNFTLQDHMACEQAALVAALEINKQNAVFEAERRSKGELLEELLSGRIESVEAAKRRAHALDFELEADLAVFLLEWSMEGHLNREDMIFQMDELFKDFPGGLLYLIRGTELVCLAGVSDHSKEQLRALLTKLVENSVFATHKLSIGVGRSYHDLKSIPLSYKEAKAASRVGSSIMKASRVTFFAELGALCCLYEVKDFPQVKVFYEETVGPLKRYDRENDSQLLKTLEAYFENGCNLRQTARALFVHRNTLDYRLGKIEEITNKKLKNHNDLFDLQLAIRLDKFIS